MTISDEIKALVSTLEMQLNGFAKAAYEKDKRIAELERQLAEASAPAVEQPPVARVTKGTQFGPGLAFLANGQALPKPGTLLYAAPQAADTDKVREAVESMNRAKLLPIWDNDVPHKLHVELDVIFKALSSMAAQAPVREVPGGWKLVPVAITEAMHVAAVKAIIRSTGNDDCPPNVWRAMLNAAPQSDAQDQSYEDRMARDMEGCNGIGMVPDRRFKEDDSAFDLLGKLLDHTSQLQMLWGLNEPGALVRFSEVSSILFAASKVIRAPAAPLPAAPVQQESEKP